MTAKAVRLSSGSRQVLALHCSLAHARAWRGLAAAVDGQATVTAFDLPGHGHAPPVEGDEHRVATDWGLGLLEAPAHLVGHSYGGTVALRMALEAPDKVQSLTLYEPVLFAAALRDDPEALAGHDADLVDYFAAVERADHLCAAQTFNAYWGDGTRWEDLSKRAQAYMVERIVFVIRSAGVLFEDSAGLLDRLSQLNLPVTLVAGANTRPVIHAITQALVARIPGATQALLEGAGHMGPISHAPAFAQIAQGTWAKA